MHGYEITRAEMGGYYVRRCAADDGRYRVPVQFAGSLDDCVKFVESEFGRHERERIAQEDRRGA